MFLTAKNPLNKVCFDLSFSLNLMPYKLKLYKYNQISQNGKEWYVYM